MKKKKKKKQKTLQTSSSKLSTKYDQLAPNIAKNMLARSLTPALLLIYLTT
jgi:Skp family chaperone for outer membrane proteins